VTCFTLLLDGEDVHLRSAMFSLFISKSVSELIKSHAKKLLALSKTSQTWNDSQYSKVIRIVNLETLELLRGYWVHYSNEENTTETFTNRYRDAVKKVINQYRQSPPITFSEGVAQLFWDKSTVQFHCNPLFAYSDAAGSRFAVHKDTNFLAGFRELPEWDLQDVLTGAMEQFEKWCNAFHKTKSLKIRFFIGDAMSLCLGLTELDDPISVANCYSRPGSSQRLRIDSEDYHSNISDRAPTKFNVIDTAHLIDTVGLLNLFPNTVSFLHSTTSVLYTSSRENTGLVTLLCGDSRVMCVLLGIAPVPYLCGVTTASIGNRITWRMGKSGDAILQWSQVKPTCDTEEVAEFLLQLYIRMFPGDILECSAPADRTQLYTKAAYSALISFLKRRTICPWGMSTSLLVRKLTTELDKKKVEFNTLDFGIQNDIAGLYNEDAQKIPGLATYNIGVLRELDTADYAAVVLTVPRFMLRAIYQKIEQNPNIKIAFQLFMQRTNAHRVHVYSSTHAVFGKVVSSADGTAGIIQVDPAGWHGDSDLQVCGFMSKIILHFWADFPNNRIGARLFPSDDVKKTFGGFSANPTNPEHISVYNTCLKHVDSGIYFFKALPGLEQPGRPFEAFLGSEVAFENSKFVVGFPKLGLESNDFTTKINLLGAAHDSLKQGEQISVFQRSPCTLTVTFGTYDLQCSFIAPVTLSGSKLRVSRASGWIEVIAPLSSPVALGHFRLNPFPLCRSPDYNIYGFHLPYVKLDKLPTFDASEPWLKAHLKKMFKYQPLDSKDVLTSIKKQIETFFLSSTRVIRLNWNGQSIVFFRGNTYFDNDNHSIVARAYVLPVLKSFAIPAIEVGATEDEIQFWRSALPGLIERSRTWDHGSGCEYVLADIVRPGLKSICSCGEGNVEIDFAKEWKQYASQVTLFAMSPLFGAPYIGVKEIEAEKTGVEKTGVEKDMENVKIEDRSPNVAGDACKVCSKAPSKKCGKCLSVSYCSRECQTKDWKSHKVSCRAKH
jgi:cellobiose-specific phosphotransferase system component IIB